MNFSQNLILSCNILAAHKLRTLLSITGIIVGVGAVILMVSAGQGAEKQILDRIRDMGTNLIIVNAGQTRIFAGRQRQIATVTTLIPSDAESIVNDCSSVAAAAPAITKKLSAQWESETTNTNVLAITSEGFHIRNTAIASGRFFTPEEGRARRRLAVVGPTVVQNLFDGDNPIGLSIRINRIPFNVIGVTEPKGVDTAGMDQDDLIIVPLATAMRRLVNAAHVDAIYVQAANGDFLKKAEDEIRQILRLRHRLRNKPDDFTILNQATLLETEQEIARSLTFLIGSVAGISLLVGGVGILAVMLISVHERVREIGLRRSVGALQQDIRNQFLVEAVILAGSGGLIGALMGLSGAWAFSRLGYWEPVISWSSVGVGLGFSVSLGMVFGIYPAIRAARLEPIEALRAE